MCVALQISFFFLTRPRIFFSTDKIVGRPDGAAVDSLGNYSDVNWFLKLSKRQLIRYIRELHDIWNYRAQLTSEIKLKICFPDIVVHYVRNLY